jgi:protein-S-isoprenylcysteine O-methyltransferase Ste14
MKNRIPLIMSGSLVVLIFLFTAIRIGRVTDIPVGDIAFVLAYIAWIAAELRISVQEMGQGDKTKDYGTCALYAVGQAVVFISALYFAPVGKTFSVAHIAGFVVFVSGVLFRLWAIRTLGRYYSHIVREVEGHRIVDSGPYRAVRHPAYLGMIVANIGVTVFFFNAVTLCLLLLLLVPAIVLRILIEERTLFTIDGYPAFAESRKRLMPGVW